MARPKGTPKTGGRQKGSLNKRTKEIHESLELVMAGLASTLIQDIQSVNPSRRLQLYTDLMNYIKPKLASNKNDDNVNHTGEVVISVNFDGVNVGNSLGVDLNEED